jgi:sulfate adenylyltransferase
MANTPHGGLLKDLHARDAGLHDKLIEEARSLKDIFLTEVSLFVFHPAVRDFT